MCLGGCAENSFIRAAALIASRFAFRSFTNRKAASGGSSRPCRSLKNGASHAERPFSIPSRKAESCLGRIVSAVLVFEEWRQSCREAILDTGLRRIVMSAIEKPEVLFVLGGPGSGKGTTCQDIVKKCGCVHLSAGDLLREERVKPNSEFGDLIEGHIRNGTIVPVEITCSLLERAMNESDNPKKRFLIDGFPRNRDNVDGWTKTMSDKVILKGVIFLECSEEICTTRCLNRGLKGSGRSDDNAESLKKRHLTYMNDTMPIIKHFEKLGMVYKFDSSHPPAKVFESVYEKLKEIGW